MPVLPCRADFSLYHKEVYQFLLAVQQNCCQRNSTQIASIAIEIDKIDPLAVLEKMAQPQQLNFYIENAGKQEAIAAIDAVAQVNFVGTNRFKKAQEFIQSCLADSSTFNSVSHPFAGIHFFCSFSFFNETSQADYPFAPAAVFLPRWQIARQKNTYVLVANLSIKPNADVEVLFQELLQNIQDIISKKGFSKNRNFNRNLSQVDVSTVEKFKCSVNDCLDCIQQKHLHKVVLAHAIDVGSEEPFNLFQSLNNLRQIHPNCYVFSISNGKGQNFIGASPERLISIRNQQLMTDALAGSAPRGKTAVEDTDLADRLLSNEKERHEHRVVINFITQRLYQLGIVPQLLTPRLRQLSNIQHLWTPIQAKVPAHVHPLEIVAELHPTPAVAGDARNIACAKIRHYEDFERGLYAAPLGWVNDKGDSEFIVGIRSALIDGDHARLYAGAGIVEGSDPEKEIAEIKLKLQALLKALV